LGSIPKASLMSGLTESEIEVYDREVKRLQNGEVEPEVAVDSISAETGHPESEVRMEIQAAVERTQLQRIGKFK